MLDTRDKPDQADALRDADECYRCGYALVGIADGQPCPECGLLAIRSRRISDELHNTRPRWLRRISWGVNLILLAILIGASWPIVLGFLSPWLYEQLWKWGRSSWWNTIWGNLVDIAIASLGIHVAALLIIGAAGLLTTPELYAPADQADRHRRLAIRTLSWLPFVGILIHDVATVYRRSYRNETPTLLMELSGPLLATIGGALFVLALFLQLRSLARRARSAHLAEHCGIVGSGAAASLFYFAAVVVVFTVVPHSNFWISRSNIPLLLLLILGTAGGLFLLWSLYLLIRFAFAFRKASRELRSRWQTSDRAQNPGW